METTLPRIAGIGPPSRNLRGIGIDAEQVSRFTRFATGETAWRHVYSPREAEHLVAQERAAIAFCASFCCKEAICKALGEAYAFPQCECLYRPGAPEQQIVLAAGLQERLAGAEVRVRFDEQFLGERGECVVEVYLVRAAGSHRATLSVAEVEADRRQVEERHLSPPEIADLGRRRVQSLAGFLAVKRALVALWAAAGVAAAAQPRDFQLAHHASGAPRLVAAPDGVALAAISISISHTRQWAYGLAALGEDPDRP